jgi:hypothetical protein
MAIDLKVEQGIPAGEVTKIIPSFREGKTTHVSRVLRMILVGTRVPDGSRVRLEALKIGSQWVTTARCIREYGERLAAAQIAAHGDEAASRSTTSRRREITQATSVLNRKGF